MLFPRVHLLFRHVSICFCFEFTRCMFHTTLAATLPLRAGVLSALVVYHCYGFASSEEAKTLRDFVGIEELDRPDGIGDRCVCNNTYGRGAGAPSLCLVLSMFLMNTEFPCALASSADLCQIFVRVVHVASSTSLRFHGEAAYRRLIP